MPRITNNKTVVLEYLKTQLLCVIATADPKNRPQAATVAFSENSKLELFIGTRSDTRKYTNLQHNKYVALVIGVDSSNRISVQYEGVATEVKEAELERCRKIHVAKNPGSIHFINDPLERFFKVSPRWVRFCDYRKKPTIFEIKFDEKPVKTEKI